MKKTINQDMNNDKEDTSDQDIQPPYTSNAKKDRFEIEDDDG